MGRSADEALAAGLRMARILFAKRERGGPRLEIHVTENDLAVALGAAWQAGADSQHCPDEPVDASTVRHYGAVMPGCGADGGSLVLHWPDVTCDACREAYDKVNAALGSMRGAARAIKKRSR